MLIVGSGETSSFISVQSGGTLDVLSGGTVLSAGVSRMEILSGGTDQASIINAGGLQYVSSGGVVSGAFVGSGAVQTVGSHGLVIGGTVQGLETVFGVTSSVTVIPGAFLSAGEVVSAGGAAFGTILAGGTLTVSGNEITGIVRGLLSPPAMAVSAVIQSGTLSVGFAGIANGTVVQGGDLAVGSGGIAANTVLSAIPGATAALDVFQGSVSGTIISDGGTETLVSGASTSTSVLAGGTQAILGGGTAFNDVVSGGRVLDYNSMVFTEPSGSSAVLDGSLSGTGALIQSGPGTLVLSGSLSGFSGSAIVSGGTLELTSGTAAGQATVTFASAAAGVLRIDGTTAPANIISGFAAGDTIDLANLGFTGTLTPAVNGNTVTVTEGSLSETLMIAGASLRAFRLAGDGAGGTNVQVACYCTRTSILTGHGERLVEDLAIGDVVVTASG